MTLLSPPPKAQFFGDDGLPLSGGLVYTYAKDTTTPLATYTDSTGSQANANPVVLDAQGRADIWYQILPYSLVIHNSLGVLQSCSGPVEFPVATTTGGSDIPAWSDIVVYDYPDLVAGTNGYTYRCVGTNVLDDDPVGSVTGNWVNLSSIASVALTGTPTAPTAAQGTNTTQIATTAFVTTAVTAAAIPVGAVTAFIGGYFSDGANGGFTNVIGNTAANINALVNAKGWYVCNGAALNSSSSSIFNGANRYLPNITDDRFLMGDTSAGTTGGGNSSAHTHSTGDFRLTTNEIPSHYHPIQVWQSGQGGTYIGNAGGVPGFLAYFNSESTGGGAVHNHGTTSAASATENRPLFLSCFYLMKVF